MLIEDRPYRQVGEAGPAELMCVADHASNFVPDGIELGIDPKLLDEHIAVDIGVNGVADRLARRHRIPAHIATVSRLVCDLHRKEDEPAVVPSESDGHLIPGNIGANIDRRLDLYDVCAQLGQHLATKGGRNKAAPFHHPYPIQRTCQWSRSHRYPPPKS